MTNYRAEFELKRILGNNEPWSVKSSFKSPFNSSSKSDKQLTGSELETVKHTLNYEEAIALIERKQKSSGSEPLPHNPKHRGELLDIQQAVIAEFWENHNPQRPPKDDAVIAWIKEKYPLTSDHEAKAIDLICRPYRYKSSKKARAKY